MINLYILKKLINKKKETKRAYLTPSRVENLLLLYWSDGKIIEDNVESIHSVKERVTSQLHHLRNDHKRQLNPTPYKVIFFISLFVFQLLNKYYYIYF